MDDDVKPDLEAMAVDTDEKPDPKLLTGNVKPDIAVGDDVKPDIVSTIHSLEDLGPYIQRQNNAKNFVHFSDIPKVCFDEPCMLGVDEAGRGPVLGESVAQSVQSSMAMHHFSSFPFWSIQVQWFTASHSVHSSRPKY